MLEKCLNVGKIVKSLGKVIKKRAQKLEGMLRRGCRVGKCWNRGFRGGAQIFFRQDDRISFLVSLVFSARAVLKASFCDGRLPSSTRPEKMALSSKLTKKADLEDEISTCRLAEDTHECFFGFLCLANIVLWGVFTADFTDFAE